MLLLHFSSELGAPAGDAAVLVKRVLSGGWAGVDLFFVLSGFLITGILADARSTRHRFRTFYVRRALRILPLYYGFLVLLFALPPLLGSSALTTTPADQLPYWLYLQNLYPITGPALAYAAHLWSLAIEEQFYLFWPLVIFTLSRTNALRVCAVCLVGTLGYRLVWVLLEADLSAAYFHTPARLDGLALGAAIALIGRGGAGMAPLRRIAPAALALSAVLLAGAAVHPSGFDPAGVWMFSVGYTALACLFGAVLLLALDEGAARLPRLLSAAVLRFLGRYSYGLYVVHVPLIALAGLAGLSPDRFAGAGWELTGLLGYMAVMGVISIVVAFASWHLFESPFLRLKDRFPAARPDPEPG